MERERGRMMRLRKGFPSMKSRVGSQPQRAPLARACIVKVSINLDLDASGSAVQLRAIVAASLLFHRSHNPYLAPNAALTSPIGGRRGEANLLVSFFRDTSLLSSSSTDGFQPYLLSAAKDQLPSRGSKNKGLAQLL